MATLQVPFLPASPLYPVITLIAKIALIPGLSNDPLFASCANGSLAPLTDHMVSKYLKRVFALLGALPS